MGIPTKNLLHMPAHVGRAIVESGAMLSCPVLNTQSFVSYCTDRGISITRERLLLLERLGRFAPIFRVRSAPGRARPFYVPIRDGNNWFDLGRAWDTTHIGHEHPVPKLNDQHREGYYSIFQVDHLALVLLQVTLEVQLDWELEKTKPTDWNKRAKEWMKITDRTPDGMRADEFRCAIGMLCQHISERYYPYTQSDQRQIRTGQTYYSDAWITTLPDDDWEAYVRAWNPQAAANLFQLTPEKLRHAYEALASTANHVDPLEHWYQLVQFVAVTERKRLKKNALLAETLRAGALMLRSLHRDLYGEELRHPNEVHGEIFVHFPELEARKDTRRYLEFVANRYHVNPQPVAVFIVEGPTEKRAIEIIFEQYYGTHPGKYGIEIVVLGGVDTATGTKEDRFRAILRLIDYLHHHQTLTFLMLDNERYARKLRAEARNAKSIHHTKRYVTCSDYVKVWNKSFEFDNFTSAELAKAMSLLANSRARFVATEIETCRAAGEPGAELKRLYQGKAETKLNKMRLTETLVQTMLSPSTRAKVNTRPIIKVLTRWTRLAARNPLPTRQETWEINQTSKYLGKRRGRIRKAKP